MNVMDDHNYLGLIDKENQIYYKVLIIDDSHFQQDQIARLLISEKFEIVGKADTGEEGIKLYEKLKPDVVIMDIQMPGIGGIEATKKILEIDKDALVIVCTTLSNKNFVQNAILSGCKHYIVKPVKRVPFFESITKILKKYKK
jgi:two-component system, chemotaxis family, chemotaxis protein CheY